MRGDTDGPTGLPVAAVAQRVGVSVSTLRSWEGRYGLVAHGRTKGGHRRYTAADVARLQRMQRLIENGLPTAAAAVTVKAPETAGKPRPARGTHRHADHNAVARLRAAIDALDFADAERFAVRVLSEHGTVVSWTQVFSPLLQELGDVWERSGTGVECEHAATNVIHSALVTHARQARTRADPGRGALLAATPREAHTLPLQALATALAESGIASRVFGTLPATALRAAIDNVRPEAVLLFARSRETADSRLLRRIVGTVPLVCAGGTGWRVRLPATVAAARDLPTAVDVFRASIKPA